MLRKSQEGTVSEGLSLNRILPIPANGRLLISWSPDGEWLAAVFGDGSLELWHTQTWTLKEYKVPLSLITCMAWSPKTKMLALAGNNSIVLWNGETGEIHLCFNEEMSPTFKSVSWSPNGKKLACGTADKTIWIIDVRAQQVSQILIGHAKAICSVAWAPKGNLIASSAEDGSIRLWKWNTKKMGVQLPQICLGHSDGVCALAWTNDGETLASASLDHTIRLWDKTGQQKGVLEGLTGEVRSIAFLNDHTYGPLLVAKVSDGIILLWRVNVREIRVSFHEPFVNGHYNDLALHPQRPILVTSGENETSLCIWDIDLNQLFENASSTQSVQYRNAKVIIIGNSGTGKSSLNLALTDGKPVPSEIPPEKHHIRLLERRETRHEDGHREVYETFIWDMGGRSGYRLIHQLYLHDIAVALIVLDTRSDANYTADLRKWVHAAREVQRIKGLRSFTIKLFLVITRAETGEGGISIKESQDLQEKLGFDGMFVTSAREGLGISELKMAILESIDWGKLPEVSSTIFVQDIREFLMSRREAGQRFCDEDELYNAFLNIRTKTVNLLSGDPRAQFEACIGRVEAQGLIRRLSFDNSVMLQPELFDSYASALLDAARNDPDGFGTITENEALQGKFLIPESVRVKDKRLERILLSSIVNDFLGYEIAFRERDDEPGQQMRLVFPSQSTQGNPDLPDSEQKYCIFPFEGDVTSLYSTLAVRLAHSNFFVKQGLWRNAVTYTSKWGGMCGVSLHEDDETHGKLTVFFDSAASKQTRDVFTGSVFMHLISRSKNMGIRRIPRCPKCDTNFTEYQVRKALEFAKPRLICPVCEELVPLPRDEEAFTFSPNIQDNVQQIDHNADAQLQVEEMRRRKEMDDYDVFFCYNDDEEDKREIHLICDELEKNGIVPWFEEIDLRPGSSRLREIQHQMQKIKAAVVCFGNERENPRWREVQMEALLNQSFKRGCIIIPMLLKHAPQRKPQLPDFFDTRWIDFRESNSAPIDLLIWGITGQRP